MEPKKTKRDFKDLSLEYRKKMAAIKIKEDPDSVPIVLEQRRPTDEGPDQKQQKPKRYAIRREYRVLEMTNTIQKMSKLVDQEKGLFLFTKFPSCKLLGVNVTVNELYEKNRSEDDWLYLLYDTQKPFGGEM